MDRKTFLNRINCFFNYNKSLDKIYFNIKEDDAVCLYNMIKNKNEDVDINKFILSNHQIENFLEKTENLLLNSIYKKINIEYRIDEYALSDDGNLMYEVELSPNEFYDHTENTYYKNQEDLIEVFRIEYDGIGIYKKGLLDYKSTHENPAPSEDGDLELIFSKDMFSIGNEYSENWFFAFKSLDQLENWFDLDHFDLIDKIKVYKVKKKFVLEGFKQLAFKKEEAILLGDYCLL